MDPKSVSIVDMPFLVLLAVLAVGAIVAGCVWARRLWTRLIALSTGLLLVIATVGAGINAHYDYFPTLGALLGRRATDQVSTARFRELERLSIRRHPAVLGSRGTSRRATVDDASTAPTHGVVVPFVIPGVVSGFRGRTGQVYVPPAWFQIPHPQLPVLELLHGSPGSPADWTRGGFADVTADRFAAAHHGRAPIIVMPDVNGGWMRDTECINGTRGNAETYLTVDVRMAVVARFGVSADRAAWGIGGLSEGGYCALELGLRHPDMFSVIGDFSGDDHPSVHGGLTKLFGVPEWRVARLEAQYDPRSQLANWPRSRHRPLIWFSVGRGDHGTRFQVDGLYTMARADGFEAVFTLLGGGHTFRLWRAAFASALPFMADHLAWESSEPVRRSRGVRVTISRTTARPPGYYRHGQ